MEQKAQTVKPIVFESSRVISSAYIDSSVRLGVAQAVLLVQDNLTECFGAMECDGVIYREKFNAFWVFTKTKIHFESRPGWRDLVTVRTFPVNNAGMRTHVNTELCTKDGRRIITANQEACVLSLQNHRPMRLTDLPYPAGDFPEPVFHGEFERFPSDFTEDDFAFAQEIRSQHIDMSRHMNNIEYIKLALSVFSDDFLQSHTITDLEVHYTGESKEGQVLRVYRRSIASSPSIEQKASDGTLADGTAAKPERTYIHIKEGSRCVFECCVQFGEFADFAAIR